MDQTPNKYEFHYNKTDNYKIHPNLEDFVDYVFVANEN